MSTILHIFEQHLKCTSLSGT